MLWVKRFCIIMITSASVLVVTCEPYEPPELIGTHWASDAGGTNWVSNTNEGSGVYLVVEADNAEGRYARYQVWLRGEQDQIIIEDSVHVLNGSGAFPWVTEVNGSCSYSTYYARVTFEEIDKWMVSNDLYVDRLLDVYWASDSLGTNQVSMYTDTFYEDDTVYVIVETSAADGDSVLVDIWEYDWASANELYSRSTRTVSADRAVVAWRLRNVGDWPWSDYSKFYVMARFLPEGQWLEAAYMIYAEKERP